MRKNVKEDIVLVSCLLQRREGGLKNRTT